MDKTGFMKKLGSRVAQIREQQGMSQSELARKCDKDRQSINRLEKGKVNPSAFYLLEISRELNVTLSELMDFSL